MFHQKGKYGVPLGIGESRPFTADRVSLGVRRIQVPASSLLAEVTQESTSLL